MTKAKIMRDRVPTHFLNLDLVLRSSTDLTALAAHFGERVVVLSCGEAEHGFLLVLEAVIESTVKPSPEECIEHFLRLLESLPPEQRAVWDGCSSRIFDFGVQGGYGALPHELTIEPATLGAIAKLGLSLAVTVYAHRDDDE